MRRRSVLTGILTASAVLAISRDVLAGTGNKITGGGFQGGIGGGNTVSGDRSTARNARLVNCVVSGRGAAVDAHATSSTIVGDGAGVGGVYEMAELRGQYSGHKARLSHVVASGYASCEYADITTGDFSGVYSGHSAFGSLLTGRGQNALANCILKNSNATGNYAGTDAEGSNLVMIGDWVTTHKTPGKRLAVDDILIDKPLTPWIIKSHGFGIAGQRVNLFVFGAAMPETPFGAFHIGSVYPFIILGKDEIGYVGDKYPATTKGRNVTVAINTTKPKRSVAIGPRSRIERDDQVVINGQDVTGMAGKFNDLERRIESLTEKLTQRG